MRRFLLASTILVATGAYAQASTITPGQGSLTDAIGHVWKVTASGSITEDGRYTPGGGGTSALALSADGKTVYGQDNGHDGNTVNSGGWFNLSTNGQYWSASAAPGSANTNPVDGNVQPSGTAPIAVLPKSSTPQPQPQPHPLAPLSVCDLASSGQFGIAEGVIYDPNQQPFTARGVNIREGEEPSVTDLVNAFPGVNFVRYAIYTFPDPGKLSKFIQDLTSKGIVVELEDHTSSDGQNRGGSTGTVFTGSLLDKELAWYASVATAFKDNPYVWFGTNNEPAQSDLVALSNWQLQTYNAIRDTGNNAPIMLETSGGWSPDSVNAGLVNANYANMTNTIWDMHYYGWVPKFSTNQAVVNETLASDAQNAQEVTSGAGTMPVLVGEYGNSTTGESIDANGQQVVTAVNTSGLGAAAWAWGRGYPGDGLTDGSTPSSPYGQQVEGYIANGSSGVTGTPSQARACAADPNAKSVLPSTTPAATITPQNTLANIQPPPIMQGQ